VKLEFTWEGGDENDEASGWFEIGKDKNTLEGEVKFTDGDSSLFSLKTGIKH